MIEDLLAAAAALDEARRELEEARERLNKAADRLWQAHDRAEMRLSLAREGIHLQSMRIH